MSAFTVAILFILAPISSFGNYDVSDEFIYSVVWDPLSYTKSDDSPSMLIKSINNETYLCHLPTVTKGKKIVGPSESDQDPQLLLAEFFAAFPCIFKVEGYWTYELCHGKHIRQFRAEGAGPKLTHIVKEFYIGRASESSAPIESKQKEAQVSEPKSIHINGRDFVYYSVEYDNGTKCDLTGVPRRASVVYVCLEESEGELFQISEQETCVYQLIVFTRHLCSSPRYNSHKVYSNPITCVPHDERTSARPKALDAFEEEKEKLISLGENERLEGIFGALRVKGLKIEKIDNQGNVFYRVKTADPLEAQQESDLAGEEIEEGVSVLPQPSTKAPMVSQRVMNELRQAQRRELQSFLAGETCLTGGAGWWRHEVCYGGRITQYHEDPNTGERIEIILGKWNEAAHLAWLKQSSFRKPQLPAEKRFKLTQFYVDGDYCDQIKAPRTVRLTFICQRKVSTNVQLAFSEPSTCQYLISLESPLFCDLLKQATDDGLLPPDVIV
ncbi:hypothetical protein Aperf_G00000035955 [Anoplocephala perfoliata]